MRCLTALFGCRLSEGSSISVILVDDGSTDGTTAAVRATFPAVTILAGDGHLFWNRGMHLAFAHALAAGFDAYLWLNDDTFLFPDAMERLLGAWTSDDAAGRGAGIYVGATRAPDSGETTYGGLRRRSWLRRFRFDLVEPDGAAVECDTMNGNCVLIPDEVARRLGNLDPAYEHAMGDIDYGLRARQAGIRLIVVPGHVGACRQDRPLAGDEVDSRRARLRRMLGRKGLPPRSWLTLVRRHGGPLWPVYWVQPYLRALLARQQS